MGSNAQGDCLYSMLTIYTIIVCLHTERLKDFKFETLFPEVQSNDDDWNLGMNWNSPQLGPWDRMLGGGLRSKKWEEMKYSSQPW